MFGLNERMCSKPLFRLSDLREGRCAYGFFYNQVACCSGLDRKYHVRSCFRCYGPPLLAGEVCQPWMTWSQWFGLRYIFAQSLLQASIYVGLAVSLVLRLSSISHCFRLFLQEVLVSWSKHMLHCKFTNDIFCHLMFDISSSAFHTGSMSIFKMLSCNSLTPGKLVPEIKAVGAYSCIVIGMCLTFIFKILGGYVLDEFLGPWTLLIKGVGLALSVASGLSLGKEVRIIWFCLLVVQNITFRVLLFMSAAQWLMYCLDSLRVSGKMKVVSLISCG